MTVVKVIRYTTKPEHADENERLIREVFDELQREGPTGLRYAAVRLEDGVTFLHVAELDGAGQPAGVVGGLRRIPVRHRGSVH